MSQEFDEMGDDALDHEFADLDAEFGALNVGGGFGGSPEFAALEAEMAGTIFAVDGDDDQAGQFMMMSGDPAVDALFFSFIKKKVEKIIKKVLKLIRRYKNCTKCVPKITAAIAAFKTGNMPAALVAAYDAYRCVKRCAKKG